MARWYVGVKTGAKFEAFRSETTPTQATHGHLYGGVIGPFRTKRAALWCEKHGWNNPHAQTVAEMERIANRTRGSLQPVTPEVRARGIRANLVTR
jgi:hypothetical protein